MKIMDFDGGDTESLIRMEDILVSDFVFLSIV